MTPEKEMEITELTEKFEKARGQYNALGQMNTSHLNGDERLQLSTRYNLALAAMNEAKRDLDAATS